MNKEQVRRKYKDMGFAYAVEFWMHNGWENELFRKVFPETQKEYAIQEYELRLDEGFQVELIKL